MNINKDDIKDNNIRISDKSLVTELALMDVDNIEKTENSKIRAAIIDPPVVNGITLVNHPNEKSRKMYRALLQNNGCLLGIYEGKQLLAIMPLIKNDDELIKQKKEEFIKRRVVNAVSRRLMNKMEISKNKKSGIKTFRPVSLSVDDFWSLFSERELLSINNTDSLKSDVEKINGRKNHFHLSSSTIRKTVVNFLNNNVISSQTFKGLYGDD